MRKGKPDECLCREVREETGLQADPLGLPGIVTFVSDRWPTEYMHLYTADGWEEPLRKTARRVTWPG